MISINRLGLLFRKRVMLESRGFLIGVAGVLGGLFLIYMLSGLDTGFNPAIFHKIAYTLTLLLGGTIFTSIIFNDFSSKNKTMGFLILPATILEKLLEALLVSSIGYLVVMSLFYYIFSVLANVTGYLVYGNTFQYFNLFDPDLLKAVGQYFVIQSAFFLGAVIFNRNAFLKTLLWIFIITTVIGFVVGGIAWMFFRDFSGDNGLVFNDGGPFSVEMLGFTQKLWTIVYYLLMPFFWVLAYFKLKEKEV